MRNAVPKLSVFTQLYKWRCLPGKSVVNAAWMNVSQRSWVGTGRNKSVRGDWWSVKHWVVLRTGFCAAYFWFHQIIEQLLIFKICIFILHNMNNLLYKRNTVADKVPIICSRWQLNPVLFHITCTLLYVVSKMCICLHSRVLYRRNWEDKVRTKRPFEPTFSKSTAVETELGLNYGDVIT